MNILSHCIWEHVQPNGVDSWWESFCGLSGDKPEQMQKCPKCGLPIFLELQDGAKNTEQANQPDQNKIKGEENGN